VFVVTDFLYKSQSTLFAGMRLLKTYAKGTPVNLLHFSNKPAKLSKTNTKMHVFYHGPDCTPAATMVLPTTVDPVLDIEPPPALYDPPALTSVFKGTISGAAATVGCDSFCQGLGFVHPAFVTAHQLQTVPIPNMTVQLGDGTSKHHANLACKVQVRLSSFNAVTWLLVMTIPKPYDVLLGDQWLSEHKAQLLFDKKCLVIHTAKRKHTVYTESAMRNKKLLFALFTGLHSSVHCSLKNM
jgi:hypothetical protein